VVNEKCEVKKEDEPINLALQRASSRKIAIPTLSPINGLSPVLGYVVKQYQRTGLVGEERNIAQLFLTCETRHLPAEYRRHAISQGESGAGKSKLVIVIIRPFLSDVERYTRVTGPGIDRSEESLEGKILFLEQLSGGEPSQLKFLMTEGELAIRYAEEDRSGRFVSKIHRVKGVPIFITTLVGAQIDPQLLGRVSTLEIDESNEQTKKIIDHKLEHWSTVKREDENVLEPIALIDQKCRDLGKSVEEIKIPYAKQLANGVPSVLPMRRKIDQMLNLVGAVAFVKAALGFRPIVKIKNPSKTRNIYIIALPEDLDDALYCLGDELILSIGFYYRKAKEIHEFLCEQGQATAKDVAMARGMSQNRAREYLNHLVESRHATRTKQRGTYYYEPIPNNVPRLELKATFTESNLRTWFADNFSENRAELVIPEGQEFTKIPPVVAAVPQIKDSSSTMAGIVPEFSTENKIESISRPKPSTNLPFFLELYQESSKK